MWVEERDRGNTCGYKRIANCCVKGRELVGGREGAEGET
jgi:hypothetical protein